jgi:nucleoside-diphosphate-sugar epimerase
MWPAYAQVTGFPHLAPGGIRLQDRTSSTVLVTGATGFIARHLIVQLLDGGYRVRGTVRSLRSETALRADLESALQDRSGMQRLSLVEADLDRDAGWHDAVARCRFVQHVASPVPMQAPKDPEEVIRPARDGTLRILRAAANAGVERFVYTSSMSAIVSGVSRDHVFTANDWSNPDSPGVGPYERSKTLAERAAWEFVRSPQAGTMQFAVVNPGAVIGPMIGKEASTSLELVRKLLAREVPGVPDLCIALVDVRDVAAVHCAVMTAPHANGQRFLAAGPSCSLRDVAQVLARHCGPRGFRVPVQPIPKWLIRLVAVFDKTAALALPDINNPYALDGTVAEQLLRRPWRAWPDVVRDTADSLIDAGIVR